MASVEKGQEFYECLGEGPKKILSPLSQKKN